MVADDYGPEWPSAWVSVDWREHQRWVEVDGRRVNLIDIGEGPPLVFVHGLGGSWQNWLENICAFASDHRVIALDLPGFGHSEMPEGEITITGYGEWLDRLFAVLDIDAAAVVGNSMGGFIAAETAIKLPHRVERLVLVAAEVKGAGKPGFYPALRALAGYHVRDRLDDITCPTLIVWGSEDILVPIRDAKEFDRLVPESRLIVHDDTGHMPQLERPRRFNEDLRAFLAEQPGEQGERAVAAASDG